MTPQIDLGDAQKILNFCYVPQQWHHELGLLRRFFARVEHKVVVGVDFVQYAYRYQSNLDSAALWDEAARTDLTRTLT